MNPRISIVMPVYNAEAYLKETIESVLMQSFTDFEFIIVDDGSIDNSQKIIEEYKDKRIIATQCKHNYIATLNKGMRLAIGKYIVRMDSDDKMLPHRLQTQYEYMETHNDIDVCGSWIRSFGADSNIYKLPKEHRLIVCSMLSGNPICHPSVIMRRQVLQSLFYDKGKEIYNSAYIYAEDYKLWCDIIMNGGILSNIDEVLLMYRCSPNQLSHRESKSSLEASLKVRLDYLKYVVKQMVSNECAYIQTINELFTLHEDSKIDFYALCNIIQIIYNNYLQRKL